LRASTTSPMADPYRRVTGRKEDFSRGPLSDVPERRKFSSRDYPLHPRLLSSVASDEEEGGEEGKRFQKRGGKKKGCLRLSGHLSFLSFLLPAFSSSPRGERERETLRGEKRGERERDLSRRQGWRYLLHEFRASEEVRKKRREKEKRKICIFVHAGKGGGGGRKAKKKKEREEKGGGWVPPPPSLLPLCGAPSTVRARGGGRGGRKSPAQVDVPFLFLCNRQSPPAQS